MDPSVRTAALAALRVLRVCAPTIAESYTVGPRREACDARLASWSRAMLDDVGARVEVAGREHLDPWEPMVVMSNHQSHYDIPVLYRVLPGTVRMVAKAELFRIPIFGRALRAAEFIEVDRGDRVGALHRVRESRALIAGGVSVWIAPEGTRSPDGAVGPFKRGGFVLAEEAGVAILPVTIDGTRHILPPRTRRVGYGVTVRVTVHPRVRRDEVPDREAWIERVRAAIASPLTGAEGPRP